MGCARIYTERSRGMMYADGRKNRPCHCDKCGDSFEPCDHWFEPLEERDKQMIVTHEPAKRAGVCILCGQFFYVGDLIVTWTPDPPNPLEPESRVATHERCHSDKIWGGKK